MPEPMSEEELDNFSDRGFKLVMGQTKWVYSQESADLLIAEVRRLREENARMLVAGNKLTFQLKYHACNPTCGYCHDLVAEWDGIKHG